MAGYWRFIPFDHRAGGSEPPNEDVLKRVANVEPYTVSGQPVGLEIFAPTQSQLMEAFREVASSISRLDK